jgi:hypothetical protein
VLVYYYSPGHLQYVIPIFGWQGKLTLQCHLNLIFLRFHTANLKIQSPLLHQLSQCSVTIVNKSYRMYKWWRCDSITPNLLINYSSEILCRQVSYNSSGVGLALEPKRMVRWEIPVNVEGDIGALKEQIVFNFQWERHQDQSPYQFVLLINASFGVCKHLVPL